MKKLTSTVAILVMSAMFIGSCSEQPQDTAVTVVTVEKETVSDDKQSEFKNLDERFSYAYGADLAEKFKAEGIELNAALLAAGMRDVYGEGDALMPAGEIVATIELYLEIHAKKKEAERAVVGEKNKQEGPGFLAANAKQEGVVVTDSGLQYKVIVEGSGGYKPTEDDEVTVHYRGRFIDGTEFDSTYQRNEAYTAIVKQLVDGWAEALQLMSAGAKWELTLPAEIAYGERGSQYVGPNAVLIFEVELLEIKKESE